MTTRNRNSNVKIETTIENCRSEGKWLKVIELAEELKIGSPSNYGKLILMLDNQHVDSEYLYKKRQTRQP